MADVLRNHVHYNVWATSRLLNAVTGLSHSDLERDFGTADKSVRGTLTHLFRAERVWLGRLQHSTAPLPWALPEDEEWAVLVEQWPKLHDDWSSWTASVAPEDLDREIEYQDLKSNSRREPLWPIVLHVVNHGTHHRGQVAGFIRALGQTPPNLDFITFFRSSQS